MRHFYFRLVFGVIWLLAAGVSFFSADIGLCALYTVLGILFLLSAMRIRKNGEEK